MKKYFAIIILAICSSCSTMREVEYRSVVFDTVVSSERVVIYDSIFSRNDTIHHRTHEVVDRYIYKTTNNSDTIYMREQVMTENKHNNTPWYIAMIAVIITVIMLVYGIYRKK